MKSKKQYPTKAYIRFLVFIVMSFFTFFYRIKAKIPTEVKNQKSPYLLLGNHVGFWDPFVVGNFLPHYTHFVSSDAAFRNPVFNFFLTRLGTIPKKKNIRDTQVIRDIVAVVKQGENVGLFPEAVRNWSGTSFPLDKSIVKLIKLLKIPVIVPILKGMNLFNPRWSYALRRTKVEVHYKLLFSKDEVIELSENLIFTKLSAYLYHDEVEHQRKQKNIIYSNKRAEFISHAIFVCPHCKSVDSFIAKANNFICSVCSYEIHINKFGFFENHISDELYYDNIRDWYNWQEKWLLNYVKIQFVSKSYNLIFSDNNSKVYHSKSKGKPNYLGLANINLFIDRIEIKFISNEKDIVINFTDLQTINPQVREKLEIFYNGEAYRIIGHKPGVSALKWEIALNAIWRLQGQHSKLSPYINSDFLL